MEECSEFGIHFFRIGAANKKSDSHVGSRTFECWDGGLVSSLFAA